MAPRKRQIRMDAAIDALVPLGFAKKLIRSKVNALLKVYGRDTGWPFIEEAYYKLVIDVLLEEQEKELVASCMHMHENSDSIEVERAVDIGESSVAATSNQVDKFDESTSTEPGIEQVRERVEDNICLLPAEEERQDRKDHFLETNLQDKPSIVVLSADKYSNFVSPCNISDKVGEYESIEVHTPVASSLQRQRRKPCFGWISDEDDEEAFIFPVTLPSLRQKTPNGSTTRKEHKRRWDIKPENMNLKDAGSSSKDQEMEDLQRASP